MLLKNKNSIDECSLRAYNKFIRNKERWEKEAKIIATISNAMPNLSEFDKGYILGIAESKADKREKECLKSKEVS